jgi:hypothetical protein
MSDTREQAHLAMRNLWEAANNRLQEGGLDWNSGRVAVRATETEKGAKLMAIGGAVCVSAEFEKPDGTTEIIEVNLPEDIRDLSESVVRVDWYSEYKDKAGTNTPALREFPQIAQELQSLI